MARGPARRIGRLALGGALALCAGACVSLPDGPFKRPPADVASPLAADIEKMNPKTAVFPAFLNIPDQPDDVRPVSAWTRNIYNTLRLRRQMRALEALYPQTLYGADAFAQIEQARAAPPITPAEAQAAADRTAAFSKSGHERATAPSPTRP